MHAFALVRISALLLLMTGLAGCVTSGAPVQSPSLAGWNKPTGGSTGIYTCASAACGGFALTLYQVTALLPAEAAVMTSGDPSTRKAFEAQMGRLIGKQSSRGGTRLHIDGAIQRTSISGHAAIAFRIAGTERSGKPADPGFMYLVPDGNRMHMIVAYSATKQAARNAARVVASGLQL